MFKILPEYRSRILIKLVRIPTKGILTFDNRRLRVGDIFTFGHIATGRIRYTHTSVMTELEEADSFGFVILNPDFGLITSESFTPCYIEYVDQLIEDYYNDEIEEPEEPEEPEEEEPIDPEPEDPEDSIIVSGIDVPESGIFDFNIRLVASPMADFVSEESSLVVKKDESKLISRTNLTSFSELFGPDKLVYTTITNPKFGYFTVNGKRSKAFTQHDVNTNNVSYVGLVSEGSETITLNLCDFNSKCQLVNLEVNYAEKFEFIGDNVFYIPTMSEMNLIIQTTYPETLYELVNGSQIGPIGAPRIDQFDIIGFTEYNLANEFETDDPNRGPGYKFLTKYKNYRKVDYWNGGLPYGITLSNVGNLITLKWDPNVSGGSNIWLTPKTPQESIFEIKAINPETDETITRTYKLVFTYDGFGPEGQTSERNDL